MTYTYCTVCACRLEMSQPPTEDRPRLVCPNCGFIQYMNPKVVGATLPVEAGKVWLLRRGIEPRYGFWTYPAGYQEVDETTEGAAIRETREEIGCDVDLDGLLGVYSRPHGPVVTIVYLAHFVAPRNVPCVTGEAVEVGAFSPQDIPWHELAFPSTEQALRDWTARSLRSVAD